MSQIKELISLLSPLEIQSFPKYLAKRNKRPDAKNIHLFKALMLNKEDVIRSKIGSNTYNVLNKRLSDRLVDYIANSALESEVTNELQVFKQIVVSRKLLVHNKFKLGFKMLASAEKEAVRIKDYTLLNEVYHTLIEYSYHPFCEEQIDVFLKFENNQQELLLQERVNMVYAVIQKAFKSNESGASMIDLDALFSETYANYGVTKEQVFNFKTLYQFAELADIEGAYKKNYHNVNLFFIDKIKELEGTTVDSEKHLIYHIDLLYLIANIYFRKKKFDESQTYLKKMHEQMLRFDCYYFKEREIQYSTLLSLVYNYSNSPQKAMDVVTSVIDSSDNRIEELSNPLLVKVMIHFHQGELTEAKKVLIRLNKPDKWYQNRIGMEWLLNKKYLEILLHIELGNTGFADSRILSLNRSYGAYFKSVKSFQIFPFLKLVKNYYHNPAEVTSVEFKTKVEQTLQWKPSDEEDLFLMSFYAWLKAKMEKKPIYQTTLELIGQTN